MNVTKVLALSLPSFASVLPVTTPNNIYRVLVACQKNVSLKHMLLLALLYHPHCDPAKLLKSALLAYASLSAVFLGVVSEALVTVSLDVSHVK